jgi:hypothetical protein
VSALRAKVVFMYAYIILDLSDPKLVKTIVNDKNETRYFETVGDASGAMNSEEMPRPIMSIKVPTQINLI